MKKKILIAVDDSLHSKYAVQYSADLANLVNNLSFVLINVQPAISGYVLDEANRNLKAKSELQKLMKRYEAVSKKVLDKNKEIMMRKGINESDIQTRSQRVKEGTAKDILNIAEEKPYDAIIMGRRGVSRIQKMFTGSLTSKILEHSQIIPVWVIDGEVKSSRFLVCIDGSESSLKAVDHLSFMLAGSKDVQVTLFHILPKISDSCKIDFSDEPKDLETLVLEGDKHCVENFYAKAYKKFNEAGLDNSRIETKELKPRMNVGKAIVDEATKNKYGTIVVGRSGTSKSFFMGSVSRYVTDRASDCALWLVS
jgi:nucleotide-binding universal stress UspA family protein